MSVQVKKKFRRPNIGDYVLVSHGVYNRVEGRAVAVSEEYEGSISSVKVKFEVKGIFGGDKSYTKWFSSYAIEVITAQEVITGLE